MSLNYEEPNSASVVTTALEDNPSITPATLAAMSGVLGLNNPSTEVVVGSWDGTGSTVTAPAGEETQLIVVDIDQPAGTDILVEIPQDVATNPVWVFDTDANVQVRFNTVERVIQMGNGSDYVYVTGDRDTTIDGSGGNDVIFTTGGNDSITGGDGQDTIYSVFGDDTISGGDGNDVISIATADSILAFGDAGNDMFVYFDASTSTVDGGTGFDIVTTDFEETVHDEWVITVGDASVQFVYAESGETFFDITATDVELFMTQAEAAELTQFSYAIVDSENRADAMRLYQTALGRSADDQGAEFWLDAIEAGATVEQLATDFAGSDEFASIWPDVTNNTELVTQIYQNAFGRAPDTAGLDFWVDALDSGSISTGEFLAAIASSTEAEGITNVIVYGIV